MGNKNDKCAAAGVASAGVAASGIALMIFGGPPGIVAGGVMLGVGTGGGANAYS
jgi:hypothetical protein